MTTNERMMLNVDPSIRFWNRIAERYAAKPVADQAAYERKLAMTREYLRPQAEVLELGCGTGSTAIAHAPYVRHLRATDVSSRMIDIARSKAAVLGIDNIELRCSDVSDVHAPESSLDAVLALSLLHLLEDWRGAIAAAHRMLKPGGVLVSSTMCMDDGFAYLRVVAPVGRMLGLLPRLSFFTRDDLEFAMVEAGFRLERSWQPAPKRGVFMIASKP